MSATPPSIRRPGFITLRGRVPGRLRSSVNTVILRIGKRRLWTSPDADGGYAFTFASRRRLLWIVTLGADARGRCHVLRRRLVWNRAAPRQTTVDDRSRSICTGVFDSARYLAALRDEALADPLGHYLAVGWRQGFPPHRWFDVAWYLRENPDVAAAGDEPFTHYLKIGWKRDRHPHPGFDNTRYLARHPELLLGDTSPLHHWSRQGVADAVSPVRPHAFTAFSEFSRARPYPVPPTSRLQRLAETYRALRRPGNRVAVFTVIIGDYDTLRLPEHLSPDIDYFLYTDQPLDGRGVFTLRPPPAEADDADPTRIARHIKLHPWRWFPDHDVVIFIDANVIVRGDLASHIRAFRDSGQPLALLPHPARDCLYEEAVICAAGGKDRVGQIVPQLLAYQREGYPLARGLSETNVYACRPADPRTRAFFEAWWGQLRDGSRRDQLSANYVLWKLGIQPYFFLGPNANTRNHPDFALVAHGRHDASAYAGF